MWGSAHGEAIVPIFIGRGAPLNSGRSGPVVTVHTEDGADLVAPKPCPDFVLQLVLPRSKNSMATIGTRSSRHICSCAAPCQPIQPTRAAKIYPENAAGR